jgi:ketosteroid isomerase-like protein
MDASHPHPNVELLNRFYRAFAALDADTMASCYAPDVSFQDEVFTLAGREETMAMWRMLCAATRAKGMDAWSLQFSDVHADDARGSAHWEAHYRFSATGRLVHNIIEARFTFRDGLIASHRDRFDFWKWSRQALGAPGWLLGWTPLLRKKVQAQAAANLAAFRSKA